MKFWIYIVLIASFCTACKKKESRNSFHYEEDTIQKVMTDLYIAAEAIKGVESSKQDSLRQLYKTQISAIHQVDMELIESDILNLMDDPEKYKVIHQEVKDSVGMWFNRYGNSED